MDTVALALWVGIVVAQQDRGQNRWARDEREQIEQGGLGFRDTLFRTGVDNPRVCRWPSQMVQRDLLCDHRDGDFGARSAFAAHP